ncbi:hypothetical protein, partial [Kluyvera genomosp. 2]|uniref:hypothetical protein n=1 Tax=Kluyvera genomosp. 2 TaxID=2774054 RepID=UPI002FD87296
PISYLEIQLLSGVSGGYINFTGKASNRPFAAKPSSFDTLNLASRLPELHSRSFFLIYSLHNAPAITSWRV